MGGRGHRDIGLLWVDAHLKTVLIDGGETLRKGIFDPGGIPLGMQDPGFLVGCLQVGIALGQCLFGQ